MACSPATPAPITSTRDGVMVPAAVVIMGNIRAVAEDLRNDVALREDGGAVWQHLRALLLILRIRISGLYACTGLDRNIQSGLGEHGHNDRGQRNPPLSWINFFRNPDDHLA